jgi:thiol-disulfide isomerase/thioredoxin
MIKLKIFSAFILLAAFIYSFPLFNSAKTNTLNAAVKVKNISDKAPEIKAEKWLNTDKELTLEGLKGKVVLIEFWTFGCYNCKNTLPKMIGWYDKYKSDNFEMIGIHCPEFDRERKLENIKDAVRELGITYPIAVDNEFYNWYNYDVHAWPTIFIIDKKGEIRYRHIGEGSYKKTEETIESLLKESES